MLPRASTSKTLRLRIDTRAYTVRTPIVHVPKANVYRFGDSNNARPVFTDIEWTIHNDEAWAVIGSGSGEKAALFQVFNYIFLHLSFP